MPEALPSHTTENIIRQRHSAAARRAETVAAVIELASTPSPERITTQAIAARRVFPLLLNGFRGVPS